MASVVDSAYEKKLKSPCCEDLRSPGNRAWEAQQETSMANNLSSSACICKIHNLRLSDRINANQASFLTGYSIKSLEKRRHLRGSGPAFEMTNGRVRYTLAGVLGWLDAHPKVQSTSDSGAESQIGSLLPPTAVKSVDEIDWDQTITRYECSTAEVLPCGCTVDKLRLREYVAPRVAALLLGYSARTLENWRGVGGGPSFRKLTERCVRYQVFDLCTWLDLQDDFVTGLNDFVVQAVARRDTKAIDSWLFGPRV